MKIDNISKYLKDHDIKPSYQRLKIFEYLINTKEHPTVDQIYKKISKEIPTLSKTTVYNTLDLFVEEKIANVILLEENETRYDADMALHGHFKCEGCGCIYDLELDISDIKIKSIKNLHIKEHHIYFKGLCKECFEKEKK